MNLNRQQQILSVSLDLFYRRGISGVTMDDIAQALSISKKTLYKDFKSKELLLLKIATSERRRFHEVGNSLVFDDTKDFAMKSRSVIDNLLKVSHKIMPIFFRDIAKNHPQVHKMTLDYKDNSVNFRFKRFIQESIASGEIVDFVSLTEIVKMYDVIFENFLQSNISMSLDEQIKMSRNPFFIKMAAQMSMLLRGICADVCRFDKLMSAYFASEKEFNKLNQTTMLNVGVSSNA